MLDIYVAHVHIYAAFISSRATRYSYSNEPQSEGDGEYDDVVDSLDVGDLDEGRNAPLSLPGAVVAAVVTSR